MADVITLQEALALGNNSSTNNTPKSTTSQKSATPTAGVTQNTSNNSGNVITLEEALALGNGGTSNSVKNGTQNGTKNTAKNGTNSSTQNYADVLYNYSKFKDATSNNKGRGGRTSSARQDWLYQQAQSKAATDDAQTQQNTVNQINQEYTAYNNQTRSDYAEALYNYYKWQGQTGKDTQYGNRTDAYYRNLANSKASTATVEEMQQMYDEMTAAYNSDQTAAQSDYDLEQDYRDAKKAYDKAVSAQNRWNDTKQYGSTAYVGDADTITANHAKAVAEAKAALAAAEAKLNGRGIEIPDTSFWGTIKNAFTSRDTTTTEGFTKDEAEEYTQLQNRLTQIEDAQNYVTTTEQSDALEQERKEVINKLAEMDKSAGRAGRTYGSTDAAESFFSTIGNNAAKTATNLWGWFNESNAQTTSDYIQESINKWEEDYNNAVAKYGANSEEAKAEKAKLDANANYQSLKSSLATVKEKEAADSRLSGSGGLLGTKEERQGRATSAYELADKYKAQADEARQSLTYGQSDVGKFLTEAGLTGAEMLQDTAVGALTGIPGAGLVNMGLRVFSNTAQESRLEGDSLSTQGQKGIVAALTEVLPEVLFGPFELAYGKSLVSSSVKKFAESKAVRVALDALGEGSEEVISSFLNIVADHALGWSEDGKTIAQDLQDQSGDMLYEFLLGAFMGAIGATGQVVIEGANNATVKTPTVENTEVATTREMTAADARAALSNVEGLNLEAGRVNNTAANTIIADPTLEQAFTTLTGVQLDGTTAQMRQQISDGVRSYGYQQTQARAADTAFQSEAEAALTQQSQQQAAREAQLDEGVKAQQELNEERANFTYDSYIRGLINAGDITYVEAKALVKNENLRAIWERMTGIKLPTNVNKAAQTVVQYRGKYNAPQSKITDEAETTTAPEQTAEQTSTPITEANEAQPIETAQVNTEPQPLPNAARVAELEQQQSERSERHRELSERQAALEQERNEIDSKLNEIYDELEATQTWQDWLELHEAELESGDVTEKELRSEWESMHPEDAKPKPKKGIDYLAEAAAQSDVQTEADINAKYQAKMNAIEQEYETADKLRRRELDGQADNISDEWARALEYANPRSTQLERIRNGEVSKNFGKPENHIDQRTNETVGKDSVKAFSFDYPELHQYYAEAGAELATELGKSEITGKHNSGQNRYRPTKRKYWNYPEVALDAQAATGLSKTKLGEAINTIREDKGAENNRDAKRVELVLDDMLSNGWQGADYRDTHAPNEDYIAAKRAIDGAKLPQKTNWEEFLADDNDPMLGAPDIEQDRRVFEEYYPEKAAADEKRTKSWEDYKKRNQAYVDMGIMDEAELHDEWEKYYVKELSREARGETTEADKLATLADNSAKADAEGLKEAERVARREELKQQQSELKARYAELSEELEALSPEVSTAEDDFYNTSEELDRLKAEDKETEKQRNLDAALAEMSAKRAVYEAREHQGEVATPKAENVKQDVSDALNAEVNVESTTENVASNVVESTPKAKKPRVPKKPKADKAAQTVEQNSNAQMQAQAQTAPTGTTDTAAVPPTENTNTGNAGQGTEKERGFSANVRTDAAMESEVRQSFEEAPEMYKQLANKDTLQKAQDIYNQGFDSARSQVEQAIGAAKNGAKLAPEMIPLARMVANELSRNGDVDSARRILSDVAVELTAAGQLGQAGRILRNADPVSALQSIEKSLDSINAEFAKLHKHSDWKAELTEEERNTILNTDFTKEGAYQEVYEKITKRIGKEMPSTLFEKITELRRINMLLRPRTMIKNVASNVPMIGLRKGAETLSTGIQAALTKMGAMKQTERTRGIASKDQVKMAREYYDTHKDDINGNGNKWDIRSMLRENRTIFKGGLLEKTISKMSGKEVESFTEGLRQLTYNLLEAGDAPFVKSAFVDSLSQYCAARKIADAKDITSEAVEFATVNAMEATFKNANVIANAVNTLKRNASPAVSYAIDVIMPFTTTPANILTLMGDYSPVGLAKMFAKDGAAAKIDAFSKATVGTAIMALGFAARNLNWITGGEDDDDDKAALDAATGRGEYSINGTVSYDWAQPAGSLLAFGAEIADAVKGQESWVDAVLNAFYVSGDSVLEMSLFQNIISILKSSGSSTKSIADTILEGNATQLVPGLVGDIAKLIDENKRSTYTGGNVLDDMKAKVMAVLPGESEKLPESVNVKGETNTRGSTWQRILNTLLNPSDVTHGERNEVDNEIYRLYDTTGSTTFFPSVSPYKVEYGGETYQMSGKERETFQKTQGSTYYKLAQPLITSEMYSKLSDDEKANLLNDIRDYALDEAKREFIENKGGEYSSSKWNDVSDMSDKDAASYLTAKSALSDLKNGKGTGSTYDAVDYLIDNFSKLSTRVQNTLTDDGINVTQLRYANVVGIDSKEYYRLRNAVSADTAEWGAKTNLAKTISIYNNMPDASNEELINALDAMLQTTSGDHPTIVKRIESYIKTVGDNANVGEFLNLMVAMNDLGYGDTLSKKESRALWPALGARNNNDTFAGLTRDQFYQLMLATQYNTVITNEANARQENVEYNEINPEEEKETVILGGRLSGVDALIANFS